MLWVLVFATLMLALASSYAYRIRRLTAAPIPPALAQAPSPLQMRMLELDAAIARVRSLTGEFTPPALQACAALARGQFRLQMRGAPEIAVVDQEGPGTRAFAELTRVLAAIDDEDRRQLVDAGLDPDRIFAAMDAQLPPAAWVEQLEHTLDFFRSGIRRIPEQRYG